MAVSLEGLSPEQITELAAVAQGMLQNPTTRLRTLALHKELNPDLHIQEVDLPKSFESALAEERGKREALENRIREDEVRRDIANKRAEIVSKGIPANKVSDVEKLMVDSGMTNYGAAADFYLLQQRAAIPTPPSAFAPKVKANAPNFKDFNGDSAKWAENEAMKALHEMRHPA